MLGFSNVEINRDSSLDNWYYFYDGCCHSLARLHRNVNACVDGLANYWCMKKKIVIYDKASNLLRSLLESDALGRYSSHCSFLVVFFFWASALIIIKNKNKKSWLKYKCYFEQVLTPILYVIILKYIWVNNLRFIFLILIWIILIGFSSPPS